MRSSSEQTDLLRQQQTYCDSVVYGNLIPTNEFNLGSATQKFNEVHVNRVFLSPNTVYLGANSISATNEGLLFNGVNVVDRLKAVSSTLTSGAKGDILVATEGGVQWQQVNFLTGPIGPSGARATIDSVLSKDPDASGGSLHNLAEIQAGTSIGPSITVGDVSLTPSGVETPHFTVNGGVTVANSEMGDAFGVGETALEAGALLVANSILASADRVRFTSGLELGMAGNTLKLSTDSLTVSAGLPEGYLKLNLNGGVYKLRLSSFAVKYSLTYDKNADGATGSQVSLYTAGSLATVDDHGLIQYPSHSFLGWNTASDGTGISYTLGDTFVMTRDTTLYAKWVFGGPVLVPFY